MQCNAAPSMHQYKMHCSDATPSKQQYKMQCNAMCWRCKNNTTPMPYTYAHLPLHIAAVVSNVSYVRTKKPHACQFDHRACPDNNYCVRPWQCYFDYHVNGQSVKLIAMVKFPLPVSVILSSSAVTFTKLRSVTKALMWHICWRSLVVCLMYQFYQIFTVSIDMISSFCVNY